MLNNQISVLVICKTVMWLFVNNQRCFGYIQITTLNNTNTFGAPYAEEVEFSGFKLVRILWYRFSCKIVYKQATRLTEV